MDETTSIISKLSLSNITSSLLSIERLVTATAYLLGILFAVKAIYSMKVLAETRANQMSQRESLKEPVVYFLVAAMLLYFPTGFEILMNTTFGYSDILAYGTNSGGNTIFGTLFGEDTPFGYVISLAIQVVGVIAFVRGWVLIARSASQGQPPGGTGQGLMHVFGGILAMNIVGTIQVLNDTLFGG
jgi:intracellular multiplication protein IcmC